jgi:hypothetical protein
MELTHQSRMFLGDGLVIIVDYESIVVTPRRGCLYQELLKARHHLFKRLLSD